MKFEAILELHGKTATGISVPASVVEALGAGTRPKVRVTINGYSYRSSIAPRGGAFLLPVSEEIRAGAAIAAGDRCMVDLEVDNEPREVSVPADFAAALSQDATAQQFFEGLSYSNKLRLTLAIESAKTPETRQRRIEKTVSGLREGKA
jgi:hypothetical protein